MDMTKLDRLPSKTLADWIRKHPHLVEDIVHEGGFSSPSGMAYDILMAPGWVANDNGDPSHIPVAYTARDALSMLRGATRCECDECLERQKDA